MTFKDFNLSKEMLETLEQIGFTKPSYIQEKAIPLIMAGRDVIGQAQTGTGKTASFAIPIIERTRPGEGIQHIVLAPSRELAKQIHDEILLIGRGKNIKCVNIIGGISYDTQRWELQKKPEIMVATPGRLIDHLESKRVSINLSNIQTMTLDEADEMLNFGFYKELLKINEYLPKNKQTMLFSATFNKRIKELASKLLNKPEQITISSGLSSNALIEQQYVVIKEKNKLVTLYNMLQLHDHKSAVIFGRTRRRVDELTAALIKLGISAKGIQGDMKQKDRSKAMEEFRDGKIKALIGTDVIARGIDVDTIDLVINFDLPTEIEYYTHRIGRTGRASRKGTAISFVKEQEEVYFNNIMFKTNSKAEQIQAPSDDDMEQIKVEKLDLQLSQLLHKGREKYRKIGARIAEEYTLEHLGLIVAAASIGENISPYDIKLTGEVGADQKGGSKRGGSSRKGSSNRGSSGNKNSRERSYGSRGSSRSGYSKKSYSKKTPSSNYKKR